MHQQPHDSSTAAQAKPAQDPGEMHGPPAPAASIDDLVATASRLVRDSADQVEAVVTLGLMEFQLSLASLQKMAWLWVLLAFGLFITWALATATLVFAGISAGLPLPLALLLGTLVNAAVTLYLYKSLGNTGQNIGFSRLRQFLKGTGDEPAER